MNYPNGTKKTFNKIINYGNRGMNLENLINLSNEYYLEKDICVIHKKPTPIQIVDTLPTQKGIEIKKAYFMSPSTLDYNGIYKGKYIDFDAKETKSKTSFPINNIHEHQLNHMRLIIKHKGISFLIISINNNVYLLDGNDIFDYIDNSNRKSIPFEYIQDKGIIIEKKINPRLDYIKAIDIKYFSKERNNGNQ